MNQLWTREPVQVYRNVSNGKLSVRCKGLVRGHCSYIELEGVSLHVNKAGAKRIMDGGNKEVVAWATGHIVDIHDFEPYLDRKIPPKIPRYTYDGTGWDKGIFFNPKKGVNWIDEDGFVLSELTMLVINNNGTMWGVEG
jgi:hypothetical protein